MQPFPSMPMAFDVAHYHHQNQHHTSTFDLFESQPQLHYRPAHNVHGHMRGMSVDTAQLHRPCPLRPSHHGHHRSVGAIQATQQHGLNIQRPSSHLNVAPNYLNEPCTPYEAYLEPDFKFTVDQPSIMTMLESADSTENMKPAQSMFATPVIATATVPAASPTVTSTGAPVSPAATLAYPSVESFASDVNERTLNYTPPVSRDANPQVPCFMPQPVMMAFGSGSGTGAFPGAPESQRSNTSSSTSKAHRQERRKKASPTKTTASSSSSATKSLFTARAMSIKDLKLDSCIDASIESTGITLDDIAAYVKEPDSKDRKSEGGKKWTCIYPGCGKQFGRKENIKSHIQTHLGDRQFKCNHCNKCFVRGHDLKRHAKIHTGLKPYPCECGNSFARHDALTRHKQRGMCSGAIRPPAPRTVKRGRPRTKNVGPASRPHLAERVEKAQMTREKIQGQNDNSSIAGGSVSQGGGYSSAGELSSSASTISSVSASPPVSAKLSRHGNNISGQVVRLDGEQQCLSGDGVGLPPGVFTFTPPTSPGNAHHDAYKLDKDMDHVLSTWNLPQAGVPLGHKNEEMVLPNGLIPAHHEYPSPVRAGSPESRASGMLDSTLLAHSAVSVAPELDHGFASGLKLMPNTFDAEVNTTTNFSSAFTTPNMAGGPGELNCQPGLFLQDSFGNGNDGNLFSDDRYSPFSDFDVQNVLLDDGMLSDTIAV
ncbi:Metallothionein expression activator [Ascosphaera aggregata]|nr:Metallothionein expression activator [Ascosphaera aggregata]